VYSRGNIHPQCAVRQSDPPKPKKKSTDVAGIADPKVVVDPPAAR